MTFRAKLISLATLLLITAIGIALAPDTSSRDESSGATVTLETYDIETGEIVTGACFSLEGANNGACDGDSSGRMTFAKPIPSGTYDVGYERTAHGEHLRVGNFPLIVSSEEDLVVPVAFIKARDGTPEWVDVTVASTTADPATPLAFPDACFVIHGASVNAIHGDVSFCGADSGPTSVRTGTYLLTSEACEEPMEGMMWIAVTDPATIEIPLLANGCIAS